MQMKANLIQTRVELLALISLHVKSGDTAQSLLGFWLCQCLSNSLI